MQSQLEQVIREKFLLAVETPPAPLTRRDAALPPGAGGKAITVIGMRRAGKTTFLHQIRGAPLAAGRPAPRLVYFNFEDERLGAMEAGQLHLIHVKTAGGSEVDFLSRNRDGTEDLVQVCVDPADPVTLDREVRGLEDASAEHPRARRLLLVQESRTPLPAVTPPILIMPAWQWMLQGYRDG